jgi:hypothetical protein
MKGPPTGEWTSEYRLRPGQELQTRRVRITINEPAIPGYNEIDAVGLKAKDGTLQWAISATASSFYGEPPSETRPSLVVHRPGHRRTEYASLRRLSDGLGAQQPRRRQ